MLIYCTNFACILPRRVTRSSDLRSASRGPTGRPSVVFSLQARPFGPSPRSVNSNPIFAPHQRQRALSRSGVRSRGVPPVRLSTGYPQVMHLARFLHDNGLGMKVASGTAYAHTHAHTMPTWGMIGTNRNTLNMAWILHSMPPLRGG